MNALKSMNCFKNDLEKFKWQQHAIRRIEARKLGNAHGLGKLSEQDYKIYKLLILGEQQ